MQTIAAEGQHWPLETFLDSHRYERCDGAPPVIADHYFPIRCVTRDLRVIEPIARHAPWPDVIAFRSPDTSVHFGECDDCGSVSVVSYSHRTGPLEVTEYCPQCDGLPFDGDWYG